MQCAAQRRLQPAREGDEKLGVHIFQRPVLRQEHEKGLEHPAAPRGVGTAAKAVGAPITRNTRIRVERELEVVGTEHAHSVSNASGHKASLRGGKLKDPQEQLPESGPGRAPEREHLEHNAGHVKSR